MNKSYVKGKSTAPVFSSTRNACKLCSPLGASIVFRGIENCIPLIHGSQGCSTYIRRYIISHFKEPIDIASSNFTESSAIFGGGLNLKTALDNVIRQYRPEIVGVSTTCLSETIGEDIKQYLNEYRAENPGLPVEIIHASTPSYSGTHMDGYHEAVRSVADKIACGGENDGGVNLIPGFLSSEDMRYLNEIICDFNVSFTMLPDYSETLDGGSWEEYKKISEGGTKISAIQRMGQSNGTILFGKTVSPNKNTARLLEEKFGVRNYTIGLPIGINESDRFFSALEEITGRKTPEKYLKERGRLVDSYIDAHKYIFGKKAVLYGEEDFIIGMASLLGEIGMESALCATGSKSGKLAEILGEIFPGKEITVLDDADFETMLDICKINRPDIVIGNSKGFYLAKNLGLPLVRVGFPIHDRFGAQRILHVGYRGTQNLFDRIVNTLIEAKQMSSPIGYSYI